MSKFYYDLHIHSALSPCADNESTPNSLAGMAAVLGLDILALTDHNSAKNCPAFFKAAKRYGIIPIAGMELTTSEEIHVICLFMTLDDALEFDEYVSSHLFAVKNKPEIFGEQLIVDDEDNIVSKVENLLSVATDISIEQLPDVVKSFRGICYPAHIDRDSNGIIAVLGTFPESPHFSTVEFRDPENLAKYKELYNLCGKVAVFNSDSHLLGIMNDKVHFIELDADRSDYSAVLSELFRLLG